MIEARVTISDNFTDKVKQFVEEKYTQRYSSFAKRDKLHSNHQKNQAKRTLTDWRKLYPKPQHIQTPQLSRTHYYPKTADCRRCLIASQNSSRPKPQTACNTRRSLYSNRNVTNITAYTNQRPKKQIESIIEFSIAQDYYQNEVLKNTELQTTKERKFYAKRVLEGRTRECFKVASLLGEMNVPDKETEENATERFMCGMKQDDLVIRPFNSIKIKDKFKLTSMLVEKDKTYR